MIHTCSQVCTSVTSSNRFDLVSFYSCGFFSFQNNLQQGDNTEYSNILYSVSGALVCFLSSPGNVPLSHSEMGIRKLH